MAALIWAGIYLITVTAQDVMLSQDLHNLRQCVSLKCHDQSTHNSWDAQQMLHLFGKIFSPLIPLPHLWPVYRQTEEVTRLFS